MKSMKLLELALRATTSHGCRKPALARGELNWSEFRTLNEYRIIEKDAALERRFQPVKVDEPTVETITIHKGNSKKPEDCPPCSLHR